MNENISDKAVGILFVGWITILIGLLFFVLIDTVRNHSPQPRKHCQVCSQFCACQSGNFPCTTSIASVTNGLAFTAWTNRVEHAVEAEQKAE